jgi:APA family basic amino acid/polyamine antiporter
MRDEQRQQTRPSAGSIPFEFAISNIFALTGTFEDLTSLFLFATCIFYALAVAAMMRMRRTEPGLERPYRCWGYPWVPAVFLAGAAALTVTLWLARPVRSSIGLVLIFSGLLFYQHWRGKLPARS